MAAPKKAPVGRDACRSLVSCEAGSMEGGMLVSYKAGVRILRILHTGFNGIMVYFVSRKKMPMFSHGTSGRHPL